MAFLRIAHIFHRSLKDLQTPVEHLRLDHACAMVLVRMNDEQRGLDILHICQRRVGVQIFSHLFLPRVPSVMGGHQAIASLNTYIPSLSQDLKDLAQDAENA